MSQSGSLLFDNFLPVLLDPVLNAIQNIFHIIFHIAILEPQDMQPQLDYVFFSGPILLELVTVTFPVNLNYQL
jgi:hypothetical protein